MKSNISKIKGDTATKTAAGYAAEAKKYAELAEEANVESENAILAAKDAKLSAESAQNAAVAAEQSAALAAGTSPYVGDNGNWFIYDAASKTYVDSGKPSQGEKGDAYTLTDEDKTEIVDEVLSSEELSAPAKQLKYYGDADIVPTDGSLFNVSSSGSVTAGNDLFLISVEKLVIPYIEGTTPVREIGENAFYNATPGTKEIIIPNGVTSIGKQAFRDLSVNYITIPRSVKTIGDYAFSGCDNLSTIYYGGSPSEWEQIQIGEGNDQIIPENMLAWIEYANEYALVSDLGDISSALDAINAIQDEMLGGEST